MAFKRRVLFKPWSVLYDVAGRLVGLQNFNGTLTTYDYDNANRLTGLSVSRPDSSLVAAYSFTLDENGNRTGVSEQAPLIVSPFADEISYIYNSQKNRLLSAEEVSFSYDPEGQLTTKATNTFSFDAVHRLQSISGEHEAYFSYDGAGKRLAATRGGVTTRYIYDASDKIGDRPRFRWPSKGVSYLNRGLSPIPLTYSS